MQEIAPVRRAILSVFNKQHVAEFAQALHAFEVKLLSTGGTGKALVDAGIPYTEVSDYTGSPEMMGGRVKTLHPKIHGGLLCKRDDPGQMAEAQEHGVEPIDLVAVNLYPFQQTVAQPNVTLAEALENIDIGGPTMIRAAAKNFGAVTVVTDPEDYVGVIEEIKLQKGVTQSTRARLAAKAFEHTSAYDRAITTYLQSL